MRRCPNCGDQTADPHDVRCVCGAAIDGVESPIDPPEAAVEETGRLGGHPVDCSNMGHICCGCRLYVAAKFGVSCQHRVPDAIRGELT